MKPNKPRVLFYDCETEPNVGYTWGKWQQNVLDFTKHWSLLSFAYKWQGDSTVKCLTKQGQKSDRGLVKALHKLFNEADIVVAHNGDEFDQKKVRARMVYHGLVPPKITTSVDTKKVAKAYFNFTSNSLNDLGKYLKLGKKMKHQGFDMWVDCMKGDPKAWKQMAEYNKQDVVLLEKVYNRFLPWIQNHPNISKIVRPHDHELGCRSCPSKNVHRRGLKATHASIRQQWQCQDCNSWFTTPLSKRKVA